MVSCSTCGVSHAPTSSHEFVYAADDSISEEMRDPIDKRPIYDPKDLPCGHTFSSVSIIAHLRQHGDCPVDHQKYSERNLSNPSASLRRILDALKVSFRPILFSSTKEFEKITQISNFLFASLSLSLSFPL